MTTQLTALVIVMLGGVTIYHGWRVARFASVDVDEAPPAGAAEQRRQAASRAAALAPWRDAIGVRDAARADYVTALVEAGAPAARIEAAAIDVLAASPTSAVHWLMLAQARAARGDAEGALAALDLSQATAPQEAAPMWLRIQLWLTLWDALPAADRGLAITQVLALRPRLDGRRIEQLRATLAQAPPRARAEIAAALTARGADKGFIAALHM